MIVEVSLTQALFIPDYMVTTEVIQALLKSTPCETTYRKNGYEWEPAKDHDIVIRKFLVDDLIPEETPNGQ